MNDTPRTDAEVVRYYGHDMINADFARGLEREMEVQRAVFEVGDYGYVQGHAIDGRASVLLFKPSCGHTYHDAAHHMELAPAPYTNIEVSHWTFLAPEKPANFGERGDEYLIREMKVEIDRLRRENTELSAAQHGK